MRKLRLVSVAILLLAFAPTLAHAAVEPTEAASMADVLHALSDHPSESDACGACAKDEPMAPACSLACGGAQLFVSEGNFVIVAPTTVRFGAESEHQIVGSGLEPDPPPPKPVFHT